MVTRRDMIGLAAAGLAGTALESSGAITRSALALRGAMIGGGKKGPFDYKVEYIESADGLPFIQTGVIIGTPMIIKCGVYHVHDGQNLSRVIFGGRMIADTIYNLKLSVRDYPGYQPRYEGVCLLNSDGLYATSGEWHDVIFNDDVLLNIDGSKVGSADRNTRVGNELFIFKANYDAPSFIGRISYFDLDFVNGSYSLHLIPVVKDGVPCMYDEVSGEIFYNAGSGQFLAGPRI